MASHCLAGWLPLFPYRLRLRDCRLALGDEDGVSDFRRMVFLQGVLAGPELHQAAVLQLRGEFRCKGRAVLAGTPNREVRRSDERSVRG